MYTMRTKTDCGPAALSEVTGRPYEEVCRVMMWRNYGDSRDDLLDSPANHFLALAKMGIPYRIVTLADILSGKCKPGKTVILLHGDGIIGSYLAQHWVVLESVAMSGDKVSVYWGDGTIHHYDRNKIAERYANGGPTATAYEVDVDGKKNTRWNWWGNLMNKIFGKR